MAERNQAAGNLAIGKQTSPNTPVTPTILTPFYKQSLETNINLIQDKPVYGSKFEVFQQLQGSRSHKGSLTVMAEPFTAMYWLDQILTLQSTTGTAPTVTRVYGLSNTQDPGYYTYDLNLVSQVVRFWGVSASKLATPFANEEMQFELAVSSLGSFYGREIASISGQIVTFTTTYDPAPTTGLVVGDLIAIKSPDGSRNLNTLVISALTGTTVTVTGTITSAQAGDMFVLRPNAALTLTLGQPFLWPLTQYKFSDTNLAGALSAAQTRLESGTTLDISHKFESDDGSKRSGGFDPGSLIRTTGYYDFKTKQYFDNPDQFKRWHAISKQSAAMVSTSTIGSMTVGMNNFKIRKAGTPTQFGQTIYQDLEYGAQNDMVDGAGMTVTLVNQTATM